MSVQRVVPADQAPKVWPTTANRCFRCGDPLVADELVIAWMANDSSGYHYWDLDCAPAWGAAFMRDVWEIGHADRHPDSSEPGKYDEPEAHHE